MGAHECYPLVQIDQPQYGMWMRYFAQRKTVARQYCRTQIGA
jgi:hypothetical protein